MHHPAAPCNDPASRGACHARRGARSNCAPTLCALIGRALIPCTLLLAGAVHATASASVAAPAAFAAPGHQALPSATGGLLRVTVALVVVLGAVFAAAWLSRRVHSAGRARHPGLEVLAQLPLGPRERAVLVRVGAQQLLLGVTSGSVRTLHVLGGSGVPAASRAPAVSDESLIGEDPAGAASLQRPSFKALLLKSLGK